MPGVIGRDDVARTVQHGDFGRHGIQDRKIQCMALAQTLYGSLAFADVGECHAQGSFILAVGDSQAIEQYHEGRAIPLHEAERQLAPGFMAKSVAKFALPAVTIRAHDAGVEALHQHFLPLDPQHRGRGQIRRGDEAGSGQGEIGDGRKFVEVNIKFAGSLQLDPVLAQGPVLHLQLDLVHLEFVPQPLRGRGLGRNGAR